MAEASNGSNTPQHYEETRDPSNPPNCVLQPDVRRAARWSFLVPVIMLAIVAGLLWYFYNGQPAHLRSAEETGDSTGVVGTSGHETAGGIDPNPTFDSTESELKFRGASPSPRGDYNTLRGR